MSIYLMTKEIEEDYQVSISKSASTGSLLREAWATHAGISHCPYGPAVRIWDERTGELTAAYWRNDKGEMHRAGDKPARIKIDPLTKVITEEQYFVDGVANRPSENAATRIMRDSETGKIIHKEWKRDGKYHRDSGLPAVLSRNPQTDIITYEAYYTNGERHKTIERDPTTGEACGNENPQTPTSVQRVVKQDLSMSP